MKRQILAVITFSVLQAYLLLAQSVSPALLADTSTGEKEALSITEVKVDTVIFGHIAETGMTMTFFNPHGRPLTGDFFFPLPEGATVNGYALDVNGVMVDGVVVEKRKAREVFEKEVRKRIDPGLVEWTKGNHFKTRIFPIPAGGSRTARVRFISDVIQKDSGSVYQIPLNFQSRIPRFSLRIEVVKGDLSPKIESVGFAGVEFKQWRDSYIAETKVEDAILTDDIKIALPPVEKNKVLVQKASDKAFYFCILDKPSQPRVEPVASPGKVTILWDASGSRAKSDHKRETAILRAFFARHGDQTVLADLVLFSSGRREPKRFVVRNGDADALVQEIEQCAYDGGTQMGSISETSGADLPDYYLLFTDGLSTFGQEDPATLSRPVYAFTSAAIANHAFLGYLATRTGGAYFNLRHLTDEEILQSIGCAPFMLQDATAAAGVIEGVCPGRPQIVHRAAVIVGKLNAEQGRVSIRYGVRDNSTHEETYTLSQANAPTGDLLRRYWAQRRIHELQVFPKKNKEEIVALGKAHGLVTPGTSLIVLERLEQYVEHRIMPPAALPEMREEYARTIAEQDKAEKKQEEEKITRLLDLWNKRVEWWNKEFKYPKDLTFRANDKKSDALDPFGIQPEGGGRTDGTTLRSLRWLNKQKAEDGSWGQSVRDTGLVLLAYLSHGETPESEEFGKAVEGSIKFLLGAQKPDGTLSDDVDVQAIAAYALNEAYSFTRIPAIKPAAENATAALIKGMALARGSSGWQAAALKGARMGGLDITGLDQAMQDAAEKLKKQTDPGALYGLQLLGQWNSEEAQEIGRSLETLEFDWSRYSLEYLNFATRAKFHLGGEVWRKWNRDFAPKLVSAQRVEEPRDPDGDRLGYWLAPNEHDRHAGEVYCSALANNMLQVYYRYLPTFRPPDGYVTASLEPAEDVDADSPPEPADLDSVAIVRSPVIMRGLLNSRSPEARGQALRRYGESAPRQEEAAAGVDPEPAIVLTPWNPETPYLTKLKDAESGERFRVYMEQKSEYGKSPAFFLDCADYFLKEKQNDIALQVLSNIAELDLENASLLRILAHKLAQADLLDASILTFEEVLRLRPEEPQSYRDLALVLEKKGEHFRAAGLLYRVVMDKWDRFDEIEVIALMELNRLLPKLTQAEIKKLGIDSRLIKLLDVDIRILLTWDADLTDIDLWVTEPSGEKAYYDHARTTIGGHVSRDFTEGYGPEEYVVRKAMKGVYKIEANYFGSSAPRLLGAVTLQLDIFTNYGRANEKSRSITLRLKETKETVMVGGLEF